MKKFKIRASGCSSIMSKRGLGKTGESFLQDWVKEQLYDRRKEFSSKYTEKGNIMEQDALDFVADHLNLGMIMKNEDWLEGDYFTGTPDAITDDFVIDVKCPWDAFTFPLFETEVPNIAYFYQAQIYMNLTGVKKYKLIYCLMNTPENIIEKEAYYKCKNDGFDELEDKVFQEFKSKMTYDDIDTKYRIKIFDIDYDQSVIDEICVRVEESRNYIKELQSIKF